MSNTDLSRSYFNREPGRPVFVSLLVYLDDSWPKDHDAETLVLDAATDCGLLIRPKPGRAVLMHQDAVHRLSAPSAGAGRPRYSLVWKLVMLPKPPGDVTAGGEAAAAPAALEGSAGTAGRGGGAWGLGGALCLSRPEWGEATYFGSAARLQALVRGAGKRGDRGGGGAGARGGVGAGARGGVGAGPRRIAGLCGAAARQPAPAARRRVSVRIAEVSEAVAAANGVATNGVPKIVIPPPAPAPAPAPVISPEAFRDIVPPAKAYETVVGLGAARTTMPWQKVLFMGVLAGIYIGLGGLLLLTVGGNCPGLAASNPGLQKMVVGSFGLPVGLILVMVCGAELFTGNVALMTAAAIERKATLQQVASNWALSFTGNMLGAALLVWIVAATGLMTPASSAGPILEGRAA
ncbi:hypothetical protein MNEG_13997 [Monoraphidium neglectum]|uniref:Uncharacterized protein n=1 Tax=Monoraphidium neglectum TaxID=145388 RepID=A0A0D2MFT4_9CHLO|nr:hypothetical protein MNEG_13997 [Monoraphidium neglectum]KIY93965.1 hypothetical protein MNEG_13997 [Monoraphidium neglectum]|eukprot:XP_013892985.1 hypothetical protein MNEG_13997 [Monoraphidium neglectum]